MPDVSSTLVSRLLVMPTAGAALLLLAQGLLHFPCWGLIFLAALVAWPIWHYQQEHILFERRAVLERATNEGTRGPGTVYLTILCETGTPPMARIARIVAPGFPHHVTQCGNRRQQTFFTDEDFAEYRYLMASSCQSCGTQVWAYCLMPNHVHLIMVPGEEDGLRRAVGEAHRRYTRTINFRQGWRGHLWQERFHSFVMDEQYLLAAVRYVERSPLRAGLCESVEEWHWSSARVHLRGKDDELVRVRPLLELIPDWRHYLAERDADTLPDRIQLHARTGRPLGSLDFVKQLEVRLRRRLRPRKPGPTPKLRNADTQDFFSGSEKN